MYFVFSAFTSRPVSLLAINKSSAFFFIVRIQYCNVNSSTCYKVCSAQRTEGVLTAGRNAFAADVEAL
jgi:hypothetical protein